MLTNIPGQRIVTPLLSVGLSLPVTCLAADETDDSKTADAARKSEAPAVPAESVDDAQKNLVENSVVKIFAQVRRPDLIKPWTKQFPREVTGSGGVIEGKRILTNAHVVFYAS